MNKVLLLSFLLCLFTTTQAAEVGVNELAIPTRQGPVSTRCYAENDDARHPLVILLHGVSGFAAFQSAYESYAASLVAHGNRVCAVLYYTADDLKIMPKAKGQARQDYYAERFGVWVDAISDVIDDLSQQTDMKNGRIGLLGFSQGSFLAVAVAGANRRVDALAAAYGGIPTLAKERIAHLPPTLILHGDADKVVPVEEAYAAESFMQTRAPTVELKIYHGAKHGFEGADEKDARERMARFFGEHLKSR